MRAPRYRFPDDVRATTRRIASEMIRDGTVAATPEQLDAWIAERPEVRESLARGGYATEFTAHDLFPLLQVFLGPAGAPAPEDDAGPRPSGSRRLVVLLVLLALLALAIALVMDVLP